MKAVLICIGGVLLPTTMPGFKETGPWNYLKYLYQTLNLIP